MVEVCRVAASQAIIASRHDLLLRDEFLRWNMAFPVAVKSYLRSETGSAGELLGILSPADADALLSAEQQPLHCLQRMRAAAFEMASASPHGPQLAAALYAGLDGSLAALVGAMNAMERLNVTPQPFACAAHVRLFLLLYLARAFVVVFPGLAEAP